MLNSVFDSGVENAIPIETLLMCTFVSLLLGFAGAFIYMYKNPYTKGFVVTLTLLPAMIQVIIMLVNGNVGAGVAVMGAFSLVRFRSVAGSAREISSIFLAMAVGLATGMGYLGLAAIFLVIIGVATIALAATPFGEQKKVPKMLKVTIPEDFNYSEIFDDLFERYTKKAELIKVKTTNMGSLYELQYEIVLKSKDKEKQFLDEVRCRNGNLTIVCGRMPTGNNEL